MNKAHVPYYVEQMAVRAPTFEALTAKAIANLRESGWSEMVCGPISTGGLGSIALNLLVFNYAIGALQFVGRPMWSQLPYEAGLADLEFEWKQKNLGEQYCHPILTEFYEPVFATGLIRRAWFIDTWETSVGARWEYEQMQRRGLDVSILPSRWLEDYTLLKDLA